MQAKPGSTGYEAKQYSEWEMQELEMDRFNSYDRAIYSGSKARYNISEVYLKMEAGRPDLANDGSYQEVSITAYKSLSNAAKSKYTKVVKIKDILPELAGGEGTDYLLNVEEVNFEDGWEQLAVDSWGYSRHVAMELDESWQPSGGFVNPLAVNGSVIAVTSIQQMNGPPINPYNQGGGHGNQGGGHGNQGGGQSAWNLYKYTQGGSDVQVTDNGVTKTVYAAVFKKEIDAGVVQNNVEHLVVVDGNNNTITSQSQFKIAQEQAFEGTFRGTIVSDTIGHANNPNKKQSDEIFGKGGDDLVIAGASIDLIKGDLVMIRYGEEPFWRRSVAI